MLEILDTAHPLLTLTVVVVLLIALWLIGRLHAEIRVLQSRLDSIEGEQRGVDEALQLLAPSHLADGQAGGRPLTGKLGLPPAAAAPAAPAADPQPTPPGATAPPA